MIILAILILLAAAALLLHARVQGILGLKWKILVTSIHHDSWEISTRWYDRRAGSWRGIVTTVNASDGVVSRLGGGNPYYHSKQPQQSLESMRKYHMLARKRFFYRMEREFLREYFNELHLAGLPRKLSGLIAARPVFKLRLRWRNWRPGGHTHNVQRAVLRGINKLLRAS